MRLSKAFVVNTMFGEKAVSDDMLLHSCNTTFPKVKNKLCARHWVDGWKNGIMKTKMMKTFLNCWITLDPEVFQ